MQGGFSINSCLQGQIRYYSSIAPTFYVSSIVALIFLAALIVLLTKGVRVKKSQSCPARQWTTIISNFGTGIPRTFKITFRTKDGAPVSGEYSEQKYLWIFPKSPKIGGA